MSSEKSDPSFADVVNGLASGDRGRLRAVVLTPTGVLVCCLVCCVAEYFALGAVGLVASSARDLFVVGSVLGGPLLYVACLPLVFRPSLGRRWFLWIPAAALWVASALTFTNHRLDVARWEDARQRDLAVKEENRQVALRREQRRKEALAAAADPKASAADAATACRKAALYGDMPKEIAKRCATALVVEGYSLLGKGDLAGSVGALDSAFKLDPNDEVVKAALLKARKAKAASDFEGYLQRVAAVDRAIAAEDTAAYNQLFNELTAVGRVARDLGAVPEERVYELAIQVQRLRARGQAMQDNLRARGERPDARWNGASEAIESYLKRKLNDADSYEHVETKQAERRGAYWLVTASYRAKNPFGAKVLDTRDFYVQQGKVVGVSCGDSSRERETMASPDCLYP